LKIEEGECHAANSARGSSEEGVGSPFRAAHAARLSFTMGKCFLALWKLTSSVSFAPGLPRTSAQGFAQGDPRGQRERGSYQPPPE